jgi:hypothetical protein
MAEDSQNARKIRLRGWLDELITKFRLEVGKLTEVERSRIGNAVNLSEPCQIEIIWTEDPEFQLVVISHFKQRKDREIIINGPIKSYELIEGADSILKEPRWNRPSDGPYKAPENRELLLSDVLAGILIDFIESIKNSIFNKLVPPQRLGGRILSNEAFTWVYAGNMAESDQSELIHEVIKEAKRQPQPTVSEQPAAQGVSLIPGTMTFFYPPVIIGAPPRPASFRQFVSGFYRLTLSQKALQASFGKYHVTVSKDGCIAVTTNKDTALRIFNAIFGTALLAFQIPCFAVTEAEVGEAGLSPQTFEVQTYSIKMTSVRTSQLDERFRGPLGVPYGRKIIQEKTLSEIIRKAELVFNKSEIAEQVGFFLTAFTHLSNSEFPQAFIISWLIVEKYLSSLWDSFLFDSKIDRERRDKLTNPGMWPIDSVLETMNLSDKLSDENYKLFMELKNKRNKFIHGGVAITAEDCQKCLGVSQKIVRDAIMGLIQGRPP